MNDLTPVEAIRVISRVSLGTAAVVFVFAVVMTAGGSSGAGYAWGGFVLALVAALWFRRMATEFAPPS